MNPYEQQIAKVISKIHPRTRANPNGSHPVCVPELRTGICRRCKNPIIRSDKACPATDPKDRFDFLNDDEDD